MNQRLFVRLDEDAVCGPESNVPAPALRAHAVHERLRPYVSHILSYRERFVESQQTIERVLPDGAVRLIMNLGDAVKQRALQVIGPSAAPAIVQMRGNVDGLSITLRPGAAEALLGVPAGEIAGAVVPLDALWRGGGDRLLNLLAEQHTDKARIGILQAELVRRLNGVVAPGHCTAVHALQLLIDAAGRLSVDEVASAVGLGERRLQQLFYAHIGLPPSAWRRLARMHGCIRALRLRPGAAWADVAIDGGFYDQAHLINEFQALCGFTPTEFRRQVISGSSKTANGVCDSLR